MKNKSGKLLLLITCLLLSFSVIAVSCSKKEETPQLGTLGAPTNLAFSGGILSWSGVDKAENGYEVKIEKGATVVKETTTKESSVSLSDIGEGTFKASVAAKAVDGKFNGSASSTLEFVVSPTQSSKLQSPSEITYSPDNQEVSWAAVDNAVSYKLRAVKKDSDEITISEKIVTERFISVKGLITAEHTLYVTAVAGEGFSDSDASAFNLAIVAVKLETPSQFAFDAVKDTLTWKEIVGVDGYGITIQAGGNTVEKEELYASFSTKELGAGTFTVMVKAYAVSGSIYNLDSDEGEYEITITSLGALYAPQNVKIAGGALVWDDNNARAYEAVITEKVSGRVVDVNAVWGEDSLQVAAMKLPAGGYTASIISVSNRHDSSSSAAANYDFSIRNIKEFSAKEIAAFSTEMPLGEHASVTLTNSGGIEYARVTPTVDGWGRVGSGEVLVDFDKSPIAFIEMGDVFGGYHMNIIHEGNDVKVLRDSRRSGNTVVDIVKLAEIKLSGITTINLRLGVNNSTTTSANDAYADYRSVRLMYITEYEADITEEVKLESPKSAGINDFGQLKWTGVANGEKYSIKISEDKDSQTMVIDKEIEATAINVYELGEGNYTAQIVAKNLSNPLIIDSDPSVLKFSVEFAANYEPSDIDTANGGFVSGGGGVEASYSAINGFATINPNGERGDGFIYPKTGVNLDLNRNPMILVSIQSGTEGGYLARAKYEGTGDLVMKNDTPGAITKPTILAMRAGYNVDGNSFGSGVKNNYKFGMGVRGNGSLQISNMRIVYVTALESLVRPDAPVKLAAPEGIKLDRAKVSAQAVKGNSVYSPTYNVTVYESGKTADEAVAVLTNLESPTVVLSSFNLVGGKDYIIEIMANGDKDAKPYFSDSDPATIAIHYNEINVINDFTGMEGTAREGADNGITSLLNADKSLTISVPSKNNWGFMALPIIMDNSLITESSILEFHFKDVIGKPQFSSRYYNKSTGGDNSACTGDQWIGEDNVLYDYNLSKNATFTDINGQNGFYLGVGHGGGSQSDIETAKAYTISKLVVAEYSLAINLYK